MLLYFPKLDKIWKNTEFDQSHYIHWHLNRRVCSGKHFPSYFKFEISHDAIPQEQWLNLIALAESGDHTGVKKALCDSARTQLLLTEIDCAATLNQISENSCKTLLEVFITNSNLLQHDKILFSPFGYALAAILHSLTIDNAWPIVQKNLTNASNEWLIIATQLQQTKNASFLPFKQDHWQEIINEAMNRIHAATKNDTLWTWHQPITALSAWEKEKGPKDMQTWLKTQLTKKDVLLRLATTCYVGGDTLVIENQELLPDEFIDAVNKFLAQTPSDLTAEESHKLICFKSAWEQTQAS
ncbi:hypothetical protein [Deefgea sp. CFH1-16]|uniref:hypothetical protein n=1 Tax=Deefgea sp. CFH1-16 TaxID=2675457 RepID=UPI0015F46D02|nr:hypothetical protein [Deefgea sp. CFH1-16]MBM5574571.1 hypothetical protein [Deefgea sp. CFH1-16]